MLSGSETVRIFIVRIKYAVCEIEFKDEFNWSAVQCDAFWCTSLVLQLNKKYSTIQLFISFMKAH